MKITNELKEKFRQTCETLIENEGVCTSLGCLNCPFSSNYYESGETCIDAGYKELRTGLTPDPSVVRSAKTWLVENYPETYRESAKNPDNIEHPAHYADTVPGLECIQITQHFNFNRGNAIKYIWRAGHKNDEIEDLKKAIKYLNFEIERLKKGES